MLEPQGYDKGSSGAILKPGKDAIVSLFAIGGVANAPKIMPRICPSVYGTSHWNNTYANYEKLKEG